MHRRTNKLVLLAAVIGTLGLWPLAGLATLGEQGWQVLAPLATLGEQGWQVLALPEHPPATFALRDGETIEVETMASVGFLYRAVAQADGGLAWRWRVDKGGPAGDLMQRGQDDRPLAVHLWFPPETASLSLEGLLADVFGYPRFGRVLTYVWAAGEGKGKRFANPYLDPGQGWIIVLRDRQDGLGAWQQETIDYQADYRRHFGAAPPVPKYLAISGDSDDLGGMTLGQVSGLHFRAAPRLGRQN